MNGYRSDCRFTPFNGVVTFDHGVQPPVSAYFLQQSGSIFTAELSTSYTYFRSYTNPPGDGITGTFQPYGLWTGYGQASGSFQFGVCASTLNSAAGFGVGFFFSGEKLFVSPPFFFFKPFYI